MSTGQDIDAEVQRLLNGFRTAGAQEVSSDVLLNANLLLDLYGEDIRSRAYITRDPLRGEVILRPDFTVPVVQRHMETRADPVRYTYAGKVFRKQEIDPSRASEFIQVGFEVFDGADPSRADAEVFRAIQTALGSAPVRVATGDIGLLIAAVRGLRTSEARKAALLRHLWRPARFKALLDRYCGISPVPETRTALLAAGDPFANAGPEAGLRSRAEIEARIDLLREDAELPPISREERALIDALLEIKTTYPSVLNILKEIAKDMPGIADQVRQFATRTEALGAAGVLVDELMFEGSFGRTTLEYYDGFVFGFYPETGGAPLASGGRYDALTAQLGEGRSAPAVGAVIRPDLLLACQGSV